jgi:hypothetical protein
MAKLDPAAAREKWANRTQQATQDMATGIMRVSQAPGQAAAAKRDKWRTGIQNSEQKWATNVARVGLAEWQRAAIEIGVPRVASGVQAKGGKYESFAAEFFPHLDAGVARIRGMDDTTLEGRIQRSVAMMRHNATFKRRG